MRFIIGIFFISLLFKFDSSDASHKEVVVLPLNAWASQRVLTKVVAQKIESLGYKVKFVEIGSTDQWVALRKGLIHLQVEVWQSEHTGPFRTYVNKGFIVDVGSHQAIGREDWWYPEYVEKSCSGLPDWRALNNCASIFNLDNNAEKGIFYTGPWNYRDADLIRALKLNFTIERLKDANTIWQKLKQSQESNQPIVILNWTPNWIDVRIKGKFVEFPEYEEACELDPTWGQNKKMLHDCGNTKSTLLKKAAWPGLESKLPCIYGLLKKISFTNDMISEASALVSADGFSEEQSVALWLKKYAKHNQQWLDFQCSEFDH